MRECLVIAGGIGEDIVDVWSAKGFDGRASPDDNAAFAAVAFRDLDAHRGLEASWD